MISAVSDSLDVKKSLAAKGSAFYHYVDDILCGVRQHFTEAVRSAQGIRDRRRSF